MFKATCLEDVEFNLIVFDAPEEDVYELYLNDEPVISMPVEALPERWVGEGKKRSLKLPVIAKCFQGQTITVTHPSVLVLQTEVYNETEDTITFCYSPILAIGTSTPMHVIKASYCRKEAS